MSNPANLPTIEQRSSCSTIVWLFVAINLIVAAPSPVWGQAGLFGIPTVAVPPPPLTPFTSALPAGIATSITPPPIAISGSFWVAQGPAPTENAQLSVPPNSPVSGAIQAIAAHPTNPNILYVGAVNGGVWRTSDALSASPTWTPLTDYLPSQSIGSIEFDPTDVNSRTLIAGVARTSSYGATGGTLAGVYLTSDTGFAWTQLGAAVFANENLTSVAARGNILMAASDNQWGGGAGSGVFRSTDRGVSFVKVSGTSGLTTGPVSDLVGDPGNSSRFYAAVRTVGIFRSDDSGATWVDVTAAAMAITASTTKIEMAVHNSAGNNVVYVSVGNPGQPRAVFRSANQGGAWTAMDTVNADPGGQTAVHFSVAADPTNPNMVYVGGSPSSIYRGDASAAAGSQWTSIIGNFADPDGNGPQPGTTPHADSREMLFDAGGELIEGDDGGIYRRSSPQSSTGTWREVVGNLAVSEQHNVAYDRISKVIFSGTQDNGTQMQRSSGSLVWDWIFSGDGGDVAVDAISIPGNSVRYYSAQNLGGFRRSTFDANNKLVSSTAPALTVTGGGAAFSGQFTTPVVVNAIDGKRLILGGANSTYESLDQANTIKEIGVGIVINGTFNSSPIVYGGKASGTNNADVLYVADGNVVYVRTTAAGALTKTSQNFPGGGVKDLAADRDDWRHVFGVDSSRVFHTPDAGASWTEITGNLTKVGTVRCIETMTTDMGKAVVVGTDTGVFISLFSALGTWNELGPNLPTVPVYELVYDDVDDVLIAGTFGRGAWKLSATASSLPRLSISDATVVEPRSGTSNMTFTVSISPAPTQFITVDYATADGTATAGQDYVATSGTLMFAPTETSKVIQVPVNSDVAFEPNETLTLTLQNPVNAAISRATGQGVILNGEPPTITGFSPASGKVGDEITITGNNFNPQTTGNVVYFGAVRTVVTFASISTLKVLVPFGATYAPITVSAGGFVAYSADPFDVIFESSSEIGPSSFPERVDFSTGGTAVGLVVADFNNDGYPDLLATLSSQNAVAVLRNVSTPHSFNRGALDSAVQFGVGAGPISVAVGDLDGDGKLDVVVANYDDATISILHNSSSGGTISFDAAVTLPVGNTPRAIAVGDIDGDGVSDIVVANEGSSSVSVYRNSGGSGPLSASSFQARRDYIVGTKPAAVAIGDIDRDGLADIVVANSFNGSGGNNITVLRNIGQRGAIDFASRVSFPTAAGPVSLALGDLNLDGKLDVVTANSGNSSVSILLNSSVSGTVAFISGGTLPAGSSVRSVAIGDINGDGFPDIATANGFLNTVSVMRNTTEPEDEPPSLFEAAAPPDVFFAPRVTFTTASGPNTVLIADLDANGKPEILTANASGTISVLRNEIKTDPNIQWANPADIMYGTALSDTQLNARSGNGVPGTFVYNPPAGTFMPAGNGQTIRVIFIPYDSANDSLATNTVAINVTKAPLTVKADDKSKVYGASLPKFTAAMTGLVAGDTQAAIANLAFTTTATAASPASPPAYSITPSGTSGNYNITFVNGDLSITPATLQVTIANATRGYGDPNPAFTGTIMGAVNGDVFTASYATAIAQSAQIGTYSGAIQLNMLSGANPANYTVLTTDGTLTVTSVPLSAIARNASRPFGQSNPAFTGTLTGVKAGDNITASYSSAATVSSPVGTYAIAVALLDPDTRLGNYTVTTMAATLTITSDDPPVVTLPGEPLEYTENDAPTLIDANATVTDGGSADFDGGTLTAAITANAETSDILLLRNEGTSAGQIGVSGNVVSYGGTAVGTFTGGASGGAPLIVSFNAASTPAAAQALLRNLTYTNSSEKPSEAPRTLQITVTDGDGGISVPVAKTINVISVNDLPVIALTAPLNNATVKATAPVVLTAVVSDVDGTVTSVDFYEGEMLLGTVAEAPFQLILNNVAVGSHSYIALAADNDGGSNESGQIDITVQPTVGGGTVGITGVFQVDFYGEAGVTYDVQVSSDLRTWIAIGQITADEGAKPVLDTEQVADVGQRFFRFVKAALGP